MLKKKDELVCPKCGNTGRCEPQTLESPDGQECKCTKHVPRECIFYLIDGECIEDIHNLKCIGVDCGHFMPFRCTANNKIEFKDKTNNSNILSQLPTDEKINNNFNKAPDNPIHPDRFRAEGAIWCRDFIKNNLK